MYNYNELMDLAKEASKNAYCKYSNFSVGACLLSSNGKVYQGCNFENASYGLAICAERNAVGTAIMDGEKTFDAVAIYSPKMEDCNPCGACRQVLNEFRNNDMDVITELNGELKIVKLSYLLPESFDL